MSAFLARGFRFAQDSVHILFCSFGNILRRGQVSIACIIISDYYLVSECYGTHLKKGVRRFVESSTSIVEVYILETPPPREAKYLLTNFFLGGWDSKGKQGKDFFLM
jgi:hypothetical protein